MCYTIGYRANTDLKYARHQRRRSTKRRKGEEPGFGAMDHAHLREDDSTLGEREKESLSRALLLLRCWLESGELMGLKMGDFFAVREGEGGGAREREEPPLRPLECKGFVVTLVTLLPFLSSTSSSSSSSLSSLSSLSFFLFFVAPPPLSSFQASPPKPTTPTTPTPAPK